MGCLDSNMVRNRTVILSARSRSVCRAPSQTKLSLPTVKTITGVYLARLIGGRGRDVETRATDLRDVSVSSAVNNHQCRAAYILCPMSAFVHMSLPMHLEKCKPYRSHRRELAQISARSLPSPIRPINWNPLELRLGARGVDILLLVLPAV